MESKYSKIGSLQKSFGTDGFIKFKLFSEYKDELEKQSFLWILQDDYYVPYRVLDINTSKRLIKFDDINSIEQAIKIHNKSLHIISTEILDENEGDVDLFIGYDLYDDKDFVSKITEIRTIAGFLYGVILLQEKEVLFPFHEDLILEIDPEKMLVRMDLPEGIFNL